MTTDRDEADGGHFLETDTSRPTKPIEVDVVPDSPLFSVQLSPDLYESLFPDPQAKLAPFVGANLLGATVLTGFHVFPAEKGLLELGKCTARIPTRIQQHTNITAHRALLCTITPQRIEHVILSVNDPDFYRKAKDTALEIPSLVHTLDVISLGPTQAKVLLCEPVSQGITSRDTRVTLVLDQTMPLAVEPEVQAHSLVEELSRSALSVEEYFSQSLEDSLDQSLVLEDESVHHVFPLDFPLSHYTPAPTALEDPELFLFTDPKNLMALNYFSGDYTIVSFGETRFLIKLVALVKPHAFDPEAVYLSPILHYNLGSPDTVKIPRKPKNPPKKLPLAREVTIARVALPASLNRQYQHHFLENLKTHLESANRAIRQGALIPVTIDSVLAKSYFSSFSSKYPPVVPTGYPDQIVWFQISALEGEEPLETDQYVLDPKRTRMVQSGLVQNFSEPPKMPRSIHEYLGLNTFFRYTDAAEKAQKHAGRPVKVFEYAKTFRNLVMTSLRHGARDLGVRTAILVQLLSRSVGKATLVRNTCKELNVDLLEIDAYDILAAPGSDLKMVGLLSGKLENVLMHSEAPTVVFFRHLDSLLGSESAEQGSGSGKSAFSVKFVEMINRFFNESLASVVFVASTIDASKLSGPIRDLFAFSVDVPVPTELERREILDFHINSGLRPIFTDLDKAPYLLAKDVSLDLLAQQSAGLSAADLAGVVACAKRGCGTASISNGGWRLLRYKDFEAAIGEARSSFSESIGAPKIPNVRWEDVGGLELVKDEILDTIEMPLKNPHLFTNGLKKRSGILFYGPPGTGKTLLAKAIATNFLLNFFLVKGPELLNMYIGESEANVRRVFQRARDAKPCVVFFDELDLVAPKRGNQGDSGGVMDRIVLQLLSELDGMSDGDGEGVFVVGATNRPDLLDEALLRPGRFDKMVYLGIADSDEKQMNILQALTRKFKMEDVDLKEIVSGLPFNYTGADFYALSLDAMLNAMTRKAQEADAKIKKYNEEHSTNVGTNWWFEHIAEPEDVEVRVKMEDFIRARENLIPSVSFEELQHYLRVREGFEGGRDKAKKEAHQNGSAKKSGKQALSPEDGFMKHVDEDDDDDDLYV